MNYLYSIWYDFESCVIELPRYKKAGVRVAFRERNKHNRFMLRVPRADFQKLKELADEDGLSLKDDFASDHFLPEVAFKGPWVSFSEFEKLAHVYEVIES